MTTNMEELEQYKIRLDMALKTANLCIFEVDLLQQKYTYFANSEAIFGIKAETILQDIDTYSALPADAYQKAVSNYFAHPDDHATIDIAFQNIYQGHSASYEARMHANNSKYKWCRIDVTPIMDAPKPIKMIGVITDINSLKQETLALEKAVHFDIFTGLYNKPSFLEIAHQKLMQKPHLQYAVIVSDIDNFKLINDTYGHLAGDDIILSIAQHLQTTFRNQDIIGRFGGDEFIIFVNDIPSISWLCEKIQSLLICSVTTEIACSNSIGIAMYPQDANNLETLIQYADKALYQAKKQKGTYSFYQK